MKHLLVADLSKRYGNLKGGAQDIKTHRFFAGLDFEKLLEKKLQMPYVPKIKLFNKISF